MLMREGSVLQSLPGCRLEQLSGRCSHHRGGGEPEQAEGTTLALDTLCLTREGTGSMDPEQVGLGSCRTERVSGALGTARPAKQMCRHHGDGERGPQVTRQGWSWKPREGCLRQGPNVSSALGDTVQRQWPRPEEETRDTVGSEERKMARKS